MKQRKWTAEENLPIVIVGKGMKKPAIILSFFPIIILFLAFLYSGPLFAATFYVSVNGNDNNPGTETQPWRTIQKAANTVQAGDIVIVLPGLFKENLVISRSGSESAFIEFKSSLLHKAVIEGSVNITTTGNYIKFEGFTIKIPDGGRSGISVSGKWCQIINCFVTTESTALGLNNQGIGIGGSNNTAKGNYVEKVCFGYGISGENHIFENNKAYGLKLNGSCGDVDYLRFFGKNHLIKNNYFHGINPAEVGSAHVDCFQTFDNGGPQYSISNIIIEGNYCSDAAQGMMLSGKIYKQSSGLIVRNNIFLRNSSWCVCLVDIADARFYNNTCDTTGGIHGIWCRGYGNVASCEFKNNIIYGPGTLYGVFETAKLIDGSPDSPGKNNLLFKPGSTINGYLLDIKNQDPLFIDRELGDYRLKTGSPGIDSGMSIDNWASPTDRLGNPRPLGNGWDIGAYEYIPERYIPERKSPKSPKNLKIINRK